MSDSKKNTEGEAKATSHCQCAAPRCARCGLNVDNTEPSKMKYIEDLLCQYIRDANIEIVELRRACKYIAMSFYSLTGDETQSKLSRMADKNAIVHCLCQDIQMNNMEPLIALIELLSVESGTLEIASSCIEMLKEQQEGVESLSQCVECTSPPTTPTHPQMLLGFKSYNFFGNMAMVSSASLAVSPVSPHLSNLPSDILKFSKEDN